MNVNCHSTHNKKANHFLLWKITDKILPTYLFLGTFAYAFKHSRIGKLRIFN